MFKQVIFLTIIVGGIFLRFYQINSVPFGLNIDEISQGYNAYSLLLTGKDRYGKILPAQFRSYESFQPPLYTYLSVLPLIFFGRTNFSVRFVSIFSQLLVVLLTIKIVKQIFPKIKTLPFIAAGVILLSPWSIFFGRYATEASLGLLFTLSALLCLYLAGKKPVFFILAAVLIGLATHSYYTERIVAILILTGYVFFYRKTIVKMKKCVLIGIVLFTLIQIPHLFMMKNGSFARRFNQVSYFNLSSYEENGKKYQKYLFGRAMFLFNEFTSQYFAYLSPKNLFFSSDPQDGRSIPDLSVYYSWMIVPFFVGMIVLMQIKITNEIIFCFWSVMTSIIPASLSGDPFYTLRVFLFLWFVGIVVAIGIIKIIESFYRYNYILAETVVFFVVIVSLLTFYEKYFVLFKNERADSFGYSNKIIFNIISKNRDKQILVDYSSRNLSLGLAMAYYLGYDPSMFQKKIWSIFIKFILHFL